MHNGLTLAYLGDAIWEAKIREYLMKSGLTKVNDLHRKAIKFTSAIGEATAVDRLISECFSETEIDIFKRGRNAESTHKPKSVDLGTYHKSTGFEAVIGYLYLENATSRLEEIMMISIHIIEETLLR
ncbi:MAG: ribonuclease III domain-containing protein [Candidatus Izemoplasmatales bacterium]|nr:ribonuclease III domain-containing protein [Candidatus Izemoplasmatales bacterium]